MTEDFSSCHFLFLVYAWVAALKVMPAIYFARRLSMVSALSSVDWTAVSSQFTAVVVAAYGLYKAVAKLVSFFRK